MRSNLRDADGKPGYGIYEVGPDSIRVFTQRIGEPKQQWAALSLTHSYYDHQGRAEKYPDYSVNQAYPQVKTAWTVQTGVGIYCSPATDGERVFVADDLGRLTAYSLKKGKRLWSFAAERRIVGTPAVAEGVVVFGSADKRVYGVNATDGKLLWTLDASAPVLGAAAIADGAAYIGASDHTFRAIDLKSGKVILKHARCWLTAKSSSVRGTTRSTPSTDRQDASAGSGHTACRACTTRLPPYGPWRLTTKCSSPTPNVH